jgi:uncharacterized protein (TIGR03435 family)
MKFGSRLLTISILLASAAGVPSQSAPIQVPRSPPAQNQGTQPRLTFDVVAIHPTQAEVQGGGIKPLPNGNGYMAQNVSVKLMMSVMYRIPGQQISSGPGWFNTETFDVQARADGTYSIDELHTMFKNLLADRFGLKFHSETKEGPVYELVVDKSGLKMKADAAGASLNIPILPQGRGKFVGTRVPMEYLCWFLGQLGQGDYRPVIDKTGLTDVYDFTLEYMPDLPPSASSDDLPPEMRNRPSLQDAVQEQLGLKLVPAKGPVKVYVIDHVEQPSAN